MSVLSSKGLANQPGENNCFLNCAVQALWHVDVFRESLKVISGHRCTAAACIFCALKVTFTQLSYSEQPTLTPDALRRALAHSFCAEQRFQLGDMDDAAECLDTLLQRLHLHLCEAGPGPCDSPHCIPHARFGMRIRERARCAQCGDQAAGDPYVQLIHYVAADQLVARVRQLGSGYDAKDFQHLVKTATSVGDVRPCPLSCGASALLSRALLSPSSVLILGLVWNSQQPKVSFLADAVESIGTVLRPAALFDSAVQEGDGPQLQLTALVCYYGRHYSAFCRQKTGAWTFFDDDVVRDIGSSWRAVVHRCVRGGYQPLLLLYTEPGGEPVPNDTALKSTVRVQMEQFRRETAPHDSGSLGRSRASPGMSSPAPLPPEVGLLQGGTLSQHSRSSSQSEETLLAGGNPHPHRRHGPSPPPTPPASPLPPPPPQFANEPPSAQEFRRQGSYISAVLERPVRAALPDALDLPPVSPPASPLSSPVRRASSWSKGGPEANSGRYIEPRTVRTVLQLQQQQSAFRRQGPGADGTLPRKAPSTPGATRKPPPQLAERLQHLQHLPSAPQLPPKPQQGAAASVQPPKPVQNSGSSVQLCKPLQDSLQPSKVSAIVVHPKSLQVIAASPKPATDAQQQRMREQQVLVVQQQQMKQQAQQQSQHQLKQQPQQQQLSAQQQQLLMQQQNQHQLKQQAHQQHIFQQQQLKQQHQQLQHHQQPHQQHQQPHQQLQQHQQPHPQPHQQHQPHKPHPQHQQPHQQPHQQHQQHQQPQQPHQQHHQPHQPHQQPHQQHQQHYQPHQPHQQHQQPHKQHQYSHPQHLLLQRQQQIQKQQQQQQQQQQKQQSHQQQILQQHHQILLQRQQQPHQLFRQQPQQQQHNVLPPQQKSSSASGACPKCGIADSWTMEAGICVRCNLKIPPPAPPPLKSALSSRSSISSMDSGTSSLASAPRKKKSVHFSEPDPRSDLCQLCHNRAGQSASGYCSGCHSYLAQFAGHAR